MGGQLLMDARHEKMKMDPQCFRERQTFVKTVHEVGLASADTTPQIDSLDVRPARTENGSQEATAQTVTRMSRNQTVMQCVQSLDDALLSCVGFGAGFASAGSASSNSVKKREGIAGVIFP